MRLNKKQTIALDFLEDKKTNEVEYGGAAGGGKSILGCYWQIKNRFKYPGSRGLIGRSKLKTLKETTLVSFFKVCQMQGLRNGLHYSLNSQTNVIKFNNGSEILLKDLYYYPSDPEFDELGSLEITDAFVDENSQITEKCWNILMSRIRHDVEKNGLIPKMFGSCNPSKNFVYTRFYKPFKEGTLASDKAFVQALVTDNPDIDKNYIENLDKLDEQSRQRLRFGNWEYDDDPYILMPYEKIVDLFTNIQIIDGNRYMSIDVARLGKDKTIIRVWSGMTSIYRISVDKCRIDELAVLVSKIMQDYRVPVYRVIADEDGVGGGLVDIIRCVGFVGNSTPIPVNGERKNYQNLRSQCYFKLAEIVNSNSMCLSSDSISIRETITQELEQIKQVDADKDGKIKVISKDDIKKNIGRSPDEADALMMRMYFELQPVVKGIKRARLT